MPAHRAHATELGKLLNAVGQPIYVLDEDFTVVFANRACLEWLGCAAEAVVGVPRVPLGQRGERPKHNRQRAVSAASRVGRPALCCRRLECGRRQSSRGAARPFLSLGGRRRRLRRDGGGGSRRPAGRNRRRCKTDCQSVLRNRPAGRVRRRRPSDRCTDRISICPTRNR